MDRTEKLFGITALFDNPDSIIKAAKKIIAKSSPKVQVTMR